MPASDIVARIPLLRPLAVRNFALLWSGSVLSSLGFQLTLIAFPWLVLRLTGDPLAMGLVLAASGLPRAVFMVVGGVATDRFSSRSVLLAVTWLRFAVMAAMGVLIASDLINMPIVFTAALFFGVIDAFAWPASSAFVPKLVSDELLPSANALLQGLSQLSVMIGPAVAGMAIAYFGKWGSGEMTGIAILFMVDALGFAVALITLGLIRVTEPRDGGEASLAGMWASLSEGFYATWRDRPVRIIALSFAAFTFFWRGPFLVGIPILADQRFESGAMAFGMIGSAFGVGALVGLILAGSLPRLSVRWFGALIILDMSIFGASLLVYALTPSLAAALVVTAVSGLVDSYLVVTLISWLQSRVANALLGRVMSMMMLFTNGLAPVSAALAGALIRFSAEGVLAACGTILMVMTVVFSFTPFVRNLGLTTAEVAAQRA